MQSYMMFPDRLSSLLNEARSASTIADILGAIFAISAIPPQHICLPARRVFYLSQA